MNILDESIHNVKRSVTSILVVFCTALTFLWDRKQQEWFMFAFPHLCSRLYLQSQEVTFNCTSPPFQAFLPSPPGPRLCVIRNGWCDSHTLRTLTVSFKYAVKQLFKYSINSILLEVGNCTGGDKHIISELLTAPCKLISAYTEKQRKAVRQPGSYLGVIL